MKSAIIINMVKYETAAFFRATTVQYTTVCTVTSISGMSSSQTASQATDYYHRNNLIIVLERKSSFGFSLLNIPDT